MKNNSKGMSNDRYGVITVSFLLVWCIMLLQLVNLQIINGEKNDQASQTRLLSQRNIVASRGNILDRNGIPIAVNRVGYVVKIARSGLKPPENNEMILKLINIFEKNNDIYENNLKKYLVFNPLSFGPNINNSKSALDKWKSEMAINKEDVSLMNTPEDVFLYFRNQKFDIDPKYSDEEAYKIMIFRYDMLIKGYTSANPLTVAKDVSKETIAQIEERHQEFPGIQIDTIPYRKYVEAKNSSHIIGYIGPIDEEKYKELKKDGYGMNDLIGKAGIELTAEKYLKGTDGYKKIEVDTKGRLTSEISSNPAVPGNDVILTIDSRLQKVAMESLEKNIEIIKSNGDNKKNFGDAFAGSVVAIDVNNGEVLAMASYPSYDPNVFLAGPEDKEAQKTLNQLFSDDKNAPMLNRAISGTFIPGSTYKPITAIAAIEEGVVRPEDKLYDSGKTVIGGWTFYCLEYRMKIGPHYHIDLREALSTSCNIYFHEIGYRTGIDKIDKWAQFFGLGELTGIELPWEHKGLRANKETKKKLRNDSWRPADTAQTAIGQFDNLFTPIQLANYVSTLANGGKRFKPYLIKRVRGFDGSVVSETEPTYEKIPVKKETIDAVKEGMVAVANSVDGTAVNTFRDFPFKVAGKTGTPETGGEAFGRSSDGLFVAYAPAENPKIAVAVVLQRGVWGSNAAPVAKDVLREYFGMNSTGTSYKIMPDKPVFTR